MNLDVCTMSFLDKVWYKKLGVVNAPVILPLLPLSAVFSLITKIRRERYQSGKKYSLRVKPVVIVVGGIAVGGTGKTPLCISLLQRLCDSGYKVGLLSRGYKGKSKEYPLVVSASSNVEECGDEPLLIKLSVKDKATVVVDPNRERGAQYLEKLGVDIIVTDDGLQHYALQRDIEIIVIDAQRMLGNGYLLPAGPLREGEWRLNTADIIVTNGNPVEPKPNYKAMHLVPSPAVSLESFCSNQGYHDYLQKGTNVVALAGIGNPNRFYNTLKSCGYNIVSTIDVGDHGVINKQILINNSQKYPIVMTSKDAVKYAKYQLPNLYVLNVEAVLPESFYETVAEKVEQLISEHKNGRPLIGNM